MLGIEPRTSYTQIMLSTTDLHHHIVTSFAASEVLQTLQVQLCELYRTEVKLFCLILHESH